MNAIADNTLPVGILIAVATLLAIAIATMVLRFRQPDLRRHYARALTDPAALRWGVGVAAVIAIVNIATGSIVGGIILAALVGLSITLLLGWRAHNSPT